MGLLTQRRALELPRRREAHYGYGVLSDRHQGQPTSVPNLGSYHGSNQGRRHASPRERSPRPSRSKDHRTALQPRFKPERRQNLPRRHTQLSGPLSPLFGAKPTSF